MASEADLIMEWGRSGSPKNGYIFCFGCQDQRKSKNRLDRPLHVTEQDDKLLYFCNHCGINGAMSLITTFPAPTLCQPSVPADQKRNVDSGHQEARTGRLRDRGISPATASKTGVYEASGEVHFPYIKGGVPYAEKIRGLETKKFRCEGSPKSFFNLDEAVPDQDLFICEGEFDALSVVEVGFHAVSVPNGAPPPGSVKNGKVDPKEDRGFNYVWDAKAYLEAASRVIICTDSDEPGQALAEELARRIGKGRCWRVDWPLGCKDANDCLLKLGREALIELLKNPIPWPIDDLHDVDHFADETRALFSGGLGRGEPTGFRAVDDIFSVVPGQLVLITGIPGAGKSTWLNALVVNLAQTKDWRFAIYSSETQPAIHIGLLVALYIGKPFFDGPTPRMSAAELERGLAWVRDHFYFLDGEGAATYQNVIERLEAAVMRWGVRGFIADPVSYLSRPDTADVEWAGQMLHAFKQFASTRECAAFLVAHPTKLRQRDDGTYPIARGYEVSGSAHYNNRPDVGLTVYRQKDAREISEIHCWKSRFGWTAKEGMASLYFDPPTGRFSDDPFNYSAGPRPEWMID